MLRVVLAGFVLLGLYVRFLRRQILTWGATDTEAQGRLPGDELLEDANEVATRAIEIAAPRSAVWPWLAQLGASPRGGAYTYDWIENLLGLDMHSVDRVLPEFQSPRVGAPSSSDRTGCASSVSSPSACSRGARRTATGCGRSCSRAAKARPG